MVAQNMCALLSVEKNVLINYARAFLLQIVCSNVFYAVLLPNGAVCSLSPAVHRAFLQWGAGGKAVRDATGGSFCPGQSLRCRRTAATAAAVCVRGALASVVADVCRGPDVPAAARAPKLVDLNKHGERVSVTRTP